MPLLQIVHTVHLIVYVK